MLVKRILLIVSIILITIGAYIFMNRNYDPLARYPYSDVEAREKIVKYLNEREIKYIIDYSISPDEILPYIEAPRFNAYNVSLYVQASKSLYYCNNGQVVEVVEAILDKDLDFNSKIHEYMYKGYSEIMNDLK